jgi:hypothetical protein
MKIRHILLLLTAFLGAALLVAVAVQIRDEILGYQTAQRMVASNAVREQLLLATDALGNERSQAYVLLVRGLDEGIKLEKLQETRRRVDGLLSAAEAEIAATRAALSNTNGSLASLSRVRQDIGTLRGQVDAYLTPEIGRAHV